MLGRLLFKCTNLLESFNDWSISIQSREQITIVYIDFSKAFDLVSHQKLFVKLRSYGVFGNVLKWLQNFFTGRTLCTQIDCSLSQTADLISGVVQGSVIGPLMFLVYINELISVLDQYNIKVKLFADDVKMYITVLDVMDVQRLQLALDALVQWSDTWQMPVSINKRCLLNVGNVHIRAGTFAYIYVSWYWNVHFWFMFAQLSNIIQSSGHPILHATLMLWNQFNVGSPSGFLPL